MHKTIKKLSIELAYFGVLGSNFDFSENANNIEACGVILGASAHVAKSLQHLAMVTQHWQAKTMMLQLFCYSNVLPCQCIGTAMQHLKITAPPEWCTIGCYSTNILYFQKEGRNDDAVTVVPQGHVQMHPLCITDSIANSHNIIFYCLLII